MDLHPQLTIDGEECWQELRRHLEWAEGFSLIILFVDNTRLIDLFRERLADIYRTRVSCLQCIAPNSATELAEQILNLIREPDPLFQHMASPLWLELYRYTGKDWQRARDNLIARLNEHRELLRHRLRRPVVLVLPRDYQARFRDIAPDLWSIRTYAAELEASRFHVTESAGRETESIRIRADTSLPSIDERALEAPALIEWQRLRKRQARGADVLRAGRQAIEAALSAGHLPLAAQIAGEVVELARQEAGKSGDPSSLRDLSVSLDRVGDTARALGRWEEAEGAYREALNILERLAFVFPNQEEYPAWIESVQKQLRLVREQKVPT